MGQAPNPSPTPSQTCGLGEVSQLSLMCHLDLGSSLPPNPCPMGPACQQVPATAHLIAAWELVREGIVGGVWLWALMGPPGTDPFTGRWPM